LRKPVQHDPAVFLQDNVRQTGKAGFTVQQSVNSDCQMSFLTPLMTRIGSAGGKVQAISQ